MVLLVENEIGPPVLKEAVLGLQFILPGNALRLYRGWVDDVACIELLQKLICPLLNAGVCDKVTVGCRYLLSDVPSTGSQFLLLHVIARYALLKYYIMLSRAVTIYTGVVAGEIIMLGKNHA